MEALLRLGETVIALAAGVLAGAVIMAASGFSPWEAYRYTFEGSFGDLYTLSMTLSSAAPSCLPG